MQQANIANGPQQVNNAVPSRAGETENAPYQLLEAKPNEMHEWLNTQTAGPASKRNSPVEAVEELDGASDRTRDGPVCDAWA